MISPIEAAIEKAKRLIIVPHIFWHYFPYHILFDENSSKFLIDKFEISYAPSSDVLNYCRMKNDGERKSAVILANPNGDLPYAEEEAQKIAGCFGQNVRLFKGNDATMEMLAAIEDPDILHLACHGIFRDDDPL